MEGDYEIQDKEISKEETRRLLEEDSRRYVRENAKPCRFCGEIPQMRMATRDPTMVELKCKCGYSSSKPGSRDKAVEGWNKLQDDENYYILFYKADGKSIKMDFDTSEEAKEFYMSFIQDCEKGVGYRNEFYFKKDISMAKLFIPFKDMDEFMQNGKWIS